MATYRRFIFVCNGSDCKKKGCKNLQGEIKNLIKSENYKGKFKIIKTKCMDFCKSAPLVVINNEVLKRADLTDIQKKL
ncbi:(2Fe-2S) ferredoxin domain-containing protein [Shivajiella indica]|uniref:Ferredoxin n=1 Tax=Shivajiella indica TaxID=872115 RepID=A0ABW5BFJ0_9BACT